MVFVLPLLQAVYQASWRSSDELDIYSGGTWFYFHSVTTYPEVHYFIFLYPSATDYQLWREVEVK
jgi:hypothetical protein